MKSWKKSETFSLSTVQPTISVNAGDGSSNGGWITDGADCILGHHSELIGLVLGQTSDSVACI